MFTAKRSVLVTRPRVHDSCCKAESQGEPSVWVELTESETVVYVERWLLTAKHSGVHTLQCRG